jgi:cold shock CspA family protein
MNERMTGVIIKVIPNKGYGFIRGTEDKLVRFMHHSEAEDFDSMREGLGVSFVPVKRKPTKYNNGLSAIEVKHEQ